MSIVTSYSNAKSKIFGDINSGYGQLGNTIYIDNININLNQGTSFNNIYYHRYYINSTVNIDFTLGQITNPIIKGYTLLIKNTGSFDIVLKEYSGTTIVTITPSQLYIVTAVLEGVSDTWEYSLMNVLGVGGYSVNIIYIDGTYGNDTTGLIHRLDRPFQTIQAAVAAAITAGLTSPYYEVFPSTYTVNSSITISTASSWNFHRGVIITGTANPVFNITAGGILLTSIFGYVISTATGFISTTGITFIEGLSINKITISSGTLILFINELYSLLKPNSLTGFNLTGSIDNLYNTSNDDLLQLITTLTNGSTYLYINNMIYTSSTSRCMNINITGGTTSIYINQLILDTTTSSVAEAVLISFGSLVGFDTDLISVRINQFIYKNYPNIIYNLTSTNIVFYINNTNVDINSTTIATELFRINSNKITLTMNGIIDLSDRISTNIIHSDVISLSYLDIILGHLISTSNANILIVNLSQLDSLSIDYNVIDMKNGNIIMTSGNSISNMELNGNLLQCRSINMVSSSMNIFSNIYTYHLDGITLIGRIANIKAYEILANNGTPHNFILQSNPLAMSSTQSNQISIDVKNINGYALSTVDVLGITDYRINCYIENLINGNTVTINYGTVNLYIGYTNHRFSALNNSNLFVHCIKLASLGLFDTLTHQTTGSTYFHVENCGDDNTISTALRILSNNVTGELTLAGRFAGSGRGSSIVTITGPSVPSNLRMLRCSIISNDASAIISGTSTTIQAHGPIMTNIGITFPIIGSANTINAGLT